jgi:hypothetical protein
MPAPKKYKFPKSLAACADKIYTLREERLTAQRMVNDIEEEEKALRQYIIDTLPKSQSTGVAGKLARVTVKTKEVPRIVDFEAYWKWIFKKKAFDVPQKSLSSAAVEARWENGEKVGGVEPFTVVTLSINKV